MRRGKFATVLPREQTAAHRLRARKIIRARVTMAVRLDMASSTIGRIRGRTASSIISRIRGRTASSIISKARTRTVSSIISKVRIPTASRAKTLTVSNIISRVRIPMVRDLIIRDIREAREDPEKQNG